MGMGDENVAMGRASLGVCVMSGDMDNAVISANQNNISVLSVRNKTMSL
jgi:hypothetical protein